MMISNMTAARCTSIQERADVLKVAYVGHVLSEQCALPPPPILTFIFSQG